MAKFVKTLNKSKLMKKAMIFIGIIGLVSAATSCSRKENEETAGKGGNTTLRIVPKHHLIAKNIINSKVFIKYNTQESTTSFDDSVVCTLSDSVYMGTFSGLKKGNYYIAGTGYDSSISQYVKGGLPYVITDDGTKDITLHVTEAH